MKIPRVEQRVRRSPGWSGIEGLEPRLVLSADPWSVFEPSALFGASDLGSIDFGSSDSAGLDLENLFDLPPIPGDWPIDSSGSWYDIDAPPEPIPIDFGGGIDAPAEPTPIDFGGGGFPYVPPINPSPSTGSGSKAPKPSGDSAAPVGVTLNDAIPLGTVGSDLVRRDGSLDLLKNSAAVQLFRIDLGPGHLWRLGVELSAERLGSPLLGRLSIFDASGSLIRTGIMGMADALNDPFLFLGLEPGTYYVGLSGAGNDPSMGGYDPATGRTPTNLPPQQGGAYSIALVADPADKPTRLVGFSIDRADSADPVPTGLTLRFDGPVQLDSWDGSEEQFSPIEIVDRYGRVWRTIIASTDGSGATISLLFQERLPRGEYTIRVPGSGGLVDLIGRSPVGEGFEPGVLGRFSITTVPSTRRPNDFGALLPGQALDGVGGEFRVAPGSSTTVRLVIAYEADYVLTLSDPLKALGIELIGPDGRIDVEEWARSQNGMQLILRPGTYLIRVSNHSARWVDGGWGIRALWAPKDSVPLNGVGQGPALGMRLASPAAGLPQVGFDPTPSQNILVLGEATVSPLFRSQSDSLSAGLTQTAASAGEGLSSGNSAGLMLTPESLPIGLPTTEMLRIVALNPDQPGVLAATASIADGIELSQFVPIGFGQAVNTRDPFPPGRISVGDPQPSVRANTEEGRGEAPNRASMSGGFPKTPDANDAIDSALALLASALPRTPVFPIPSGEDNGEIETLLETAPGPRGSDTDQESRRAEVPLIRALGIGLAVGFSARYWSRRKGHLGGRSSSSARANSNSRIDHHGEAGLREEVLRRRPGRARPAQVVFADANR